MIAVHISIYGEVQGTGFRSWTKEQAQKFSLTGWTRRSSDGSIEIFTQGEEEKINDFVIGSAGGITHKLEIDKTKIFISGNKYIDKMVLEMIENNIR